MVYPVVTDNGVRWRGEPSSLFCGRARVVCILLGGQSGEDSMVTAALGAVRAIKSGGRRVAPRQTGARRSADPSLTGRSSAQELGRSHGLFAFELSAGYDFMLGRTVLESQPPTTANG